MIAPVLKELKNHSLCLLLIPQVHVENRCTFQLLLVCGCDWLVHRTRSLFKDKGGASELNWPAHPLGHVWCLTTAILTMQHLEELGEASLSCPEWWSRKGREREWESRPVTLCYSSPFLPCDWASTWRRSYIQCMINRVVILILQLTGIFIRHLIWIKCFETQRKEHINHRGPEQQPASITSGIGFLTFALTLSSPSTITPWGQVSDPNTSPCL